MQSLTGNWSHYGNWSLSVKLHFYNTDHLPKSNYFPENDHLPEIGQLLEIDRIVFQNITPITQYFQLLLHIGTIIGPKMRILSQKDKFLLKRHSRCRFRALGALKSSNR